MDDPIADPREPTARLLIRALRSFEKQLQDRLHADGYADVSVAHTNVLRHLDPDGMRMVALARDAQLTRQAVSLSVKELVKRGLVAVEPDPEDGRAKRVVYTDRGRALIQCAIGHIVELEGNWRETLGDDGYQALRAALTKLA